jgi:DME family drug/metabolite transporter
LLVTAGTLWGTGGLTGSLLSRTASLSPLAVATYRLGVGGLLILAFLLLTRHFVAPSGRPAWQRVGTIAVLAAAFQGCYFAAVSRTAVSLATLITIGASPLIVLAVEALTGRRRLDARVTATAALALGGLTLLIGVPTGGGSLTGVGLALLAASAFAVMTLVGAQPVAGLDDLTATGTAFTLGAVVLASLAPFGLAFAPAPAAISLLVVLGLAPTAIAYAAYFRGLLLASAGTAALMALLEPLVGTALAVLILGDRLRPAQLAGATLLITALVLEASLTRSR